MGTSTYRESDTDKFERMFENLSDPAAATGVVISLARNLGERDVPEQLSQTNDAVASIIKGGLHKYDGTGDVYEIMKASLPKNLSSEGCVDRLLTPARDLGNGFSAREHVLGNGIYIQPTNMPHRLYGRRFKSVPVITDMGDKRFKISGTLSDGNGYEDEVVLPA